MIRRVFENLTFFSINRLLYKYLMSFNNIKNILIILKNISYLENEYGLFNQCTIIKSFEEVNKYQYNERLKNLLRKDFFSSGSLLFTVIENNQIIAFTWFNTNFDPNGDISLLDISDYHIAGPTFVNINHRGKGLSGKLKNSICAFAKSNSQFPIYAVNSFDNVPIIKNNLRSGYQLCNVIIKQKHKKTIIL